MCALISAEILVKMVIYAAITRSCAVANPWITQLVNNFEGLEFRGFYCIWLYLCYKCLSVYNNKGSIG